MKKYVICENHYCGNELIGVNIIGVCDSIETANIIIENNRNELKRLFNNKFLSDSIDKFGYHEFENEYGETFRTGCVSTEYTEG